MLALGPALVVATFNATGQHRGFRVGASMLIARRRPFLFGWGRGHETDWVGTTMQTLILDCLNLIPSRRPTFMETIARLTQAFHLPPKTIVKQFDVKRLIFMLDNARPYMQVRRRQP